MEDSLERRALNTHWKNPHFVAKVREELKKSFSFDTGYLTDQLLYGVVTSHTKLEQRIRDALVYVPTAIGSHHSICPISNREFTDRSPIRRTNNIHPELKHQQRLIHRNKNTMRSNK